MNQDKRLSIAVPLVGMSDADDQAYLDGCVQMGADSVFLMAPCDNIVRSKRAIRYQHLSDKILPPVPEQRVCDLPSIQLAEHWAEQYRLLAPRYAEKGITPYIWICHTIGHGGALSTKEAAPFQTLIGTDGQAADGCFCPLDQGFVDYLCKLLATVAAGDVPLILLDDDFRLNYHGAVDLACFCPEHMAYYNRRFGTDLTRQELADRILGNDPQARANFQQMNSEIMLSFAGALEKAVHAVNPNTRLGLASCMLHFSSEAADIKALVRRLAGPTRPYIRVYGAPYHAGNNPRALGLTIEMERLFRDYMDEGDIEISTEGDTYPHSRFFTDKTTTKAYLLSARCAGLRNMLFYPYPFSASPREEPVYEEAVKELSHILQELDPCLPREAVPTGIAPVISMQNTLAIPLRKNMPRFERCWPDKPAALGAISQCGIPLAKMAGMDDGNGPVLLCGWHGCNLSDEELEKLLDRGAIVDAHAAKWLLERGHDLGITGMERLPQAPTFELYDGALSRQYHGEQIWLLCNGAAAFYDLKLKDGAQPCSHLIDGENGTRSIGSAMYEKNGRRIFVLGFGFAGVQGSMQAVRNLARQEQLRNAAAWLGVSSHVLEQDDLLIFSYRQEALRTHCLVKTGPDATPDVQLFITEKPVSDPVFWDENGAISQPLPYALTPQAGGYILRIRKTLHCSQLLVVRYAV